MAELARSLMGQRAPVPTLLLSMCRLYLDDYVLKIITDPASLYKLLIAKLEYMPSRVTLIKNLRQCRNKIEHGEFITNNEYELYFDAVRQIYKWLSNEQFYTEAKEILQSFSLKLCLEILDTADNINTKISQSNIPIEDISQESINYTKKRKINSSENNHARPDNYIPHRNTLTNRLLDTESRNTNSYSNNRSLDTESRNTNSYSNNRLLDTESRNTKSYSNNQLLNTESRNTNSYSNNQLLNTESRNTKSYSNNQLLNTESRNTNSYSNNQLLNTESRNNNSYSTNRSSDIEGTLEELRETHREYIKKRRIILMNNNYNGRIATFIGWNGTNAKIIINGNTKLISLSNRIKILD